MKTRTFLVSVLVLSALLCGAQIPQGFHYQAAVRDANNLVIQNQEVAFRITIQESGGGTPVYVETQTATTNGVGVAGLIIGQGTVQSGQFSDILWGSGSYELKVEVDPAGGTSYQEAGTSQLVSVPYALYSGNLSSPTRKFTVQEEAGHPVDSALFEVRNAEGQTVFAVYPEGTRVYVVDEPSKGVKGGFAVGGLSRGKKGPTQELMHVSPDSIRMYVDEESGKGVKGGFAVGGFSRGKGPTDQYFALSPANASFTLVSDSPDQLGNNSLTVSNRTRSGESADQGSLFNLTRDNYLIGHKAGESITSGTGNIILGYEAGLQTEDGDNNSFIGYHAGYDNVDGKRNVVIGYTAGKSNVSGLNNVFIGSNTGVDTEGDHNVYIGAFAGVHNRQGSTNVIIGSNAGGNADSSLANVFIGATSGFNNSGGSANVFVGQGTGYENMKGDHNTFIGHAAGQSNTNDKSNTFVGAYAGYLHQTGEMNTYIGMNAGHHQQEGNRNVFLGNASGFEHTTGDNNVFIGDNAGRHNLVGSNNIFIGKGAGISELGNEKLYIDMGGNTMENALVYGEFDMNKVRINHQLGIGRTPEINALEVNGDVSKSSAGDWLVNSDARIKTEIKEIENAIQQIQQLRPVTFRYTEEWMQMNPGVKNRLYYNFVAQEYREVFPGSVQAGGGFLEGDSEPLLQLDSQPAQVVAIKAIQELAEQNREQQALLEELRKENEALRKSNQEILELITSLQER